MREVSPILVALGKRIRSHRKQLGFTQEELANRCDLHRTYVADVERGARNVSILNVARLAKSLDLRIAQLCEGIDVAEKPTGESEGSSPSGEPANN